MSLTTVVARHPNMIAAAAEDGRVVVRGHNSRPVNFLLVSDYLKAEVAEDQARYFAAIEGYEVDGFPVVRRSFSGPQSWVEEGARLAEEAKHGKATQAEAAQGTLAEQLLNLLGPDAILALLKSQIQTQAPAVVEKAAEQAEVQQQAELDAQKAAPWTAADTIRLDEDTLRELGREFLPHLDHGGAPRATLAAELAKAANHSAYLDARLLELLGE